VAFLIPPALLVVADLFGPVYPVWPPNFLLNDLANNVRIQRTDENPTGTGRN